MSWESCSSIGTPNSYDSDQTYCAELDNNVVNSDFSQTSRKRSKRSCKKNSVTKFKRKSTSSPPYKYQMNSKNILNDVINDCVIKIRKHLNKVHIMSCQEINDLLNKLNSFQITDTKVKLMKQKVSSQLCNLLEEFVDIEEKFGNLNLNSQSTMDTICSESILKFLNVNNTNNSNASKLLNGQNYKTNESSKKPVNHPTFKTSSADARDNIVKNDNSCIIISIEEDLQLLREIEDVRNVDHSKQKFENILKDSSTVSFTFDEDEMLTNLNFETVNTNSTRSVVNPTETEKVEKNPNNCITSGIIDFPEEMMIALPTPNVNESEGIQDFEDSQNIVASTYPEEDISKSKNLNVFNRIESEIKNQNNLLPNCNIINKESISCNLEKDNSNQLIIETANNISDILFESQSQQSTSSVQNCSDNGSCILPPELCTNTNFGTISECSGNKKTETDFMCNSKNDKISEDYVMVNSTLINSGTESETDSKMTLFKTPTLLKKPKKQPNSYGTSKKHHSPKKNVSNTECNKSFSMSIKNSTSFLSIPSNNEYENCASKNNEDMEITEVFADCSESKNEYKQSLESSDENKIIQPEDKQSIQENSFNDFVMIKSSMSENENNTSDQKCEFQSLKQVVEAIDIFKSEFVNWLKETAIEKYHEKTSVSEKINQQSKQKDIKSLNFVFSLQQQLENEAKVNEIASYYREEIKDEGYSNDEENFDEYVPFNINFDEINKKYQLDE